jgi:hypothetical protein
VDSSSFDAAGRSCASRKIIAVWSQPGKAGTEKPGQYTQLQFLLGVELGFGEGGVFARAAGRVWREPPVQHRFQMRREYTILERGGVS